MNLGLLVKIKAMNDCHKEESYDSIIPKKFPYFLFKF